MAEPTVRGFSIATKCETVAEFVEKYRDRSDETSILVNVVESRVVGTECAFAILLANKKPVLAGTCVVLDVFTDSNNPFKRPGMRLGIKRLGLESERVFAELEAARVSAKRKQTAMSQAAASGAGVPRPTMAMPIVTAEIPAIHVTPRGDGVVVNVPRTRTQPMRGLRSEPVVIEPRKKRLETVQIPSREEAAAPPRTARSSSSPVEVRAESSSDVPKPMLRIVKDDELNDDVVVKAESVETLTAPKELAAPAVDAKRAATSELPAKPAAKSELPSWAKLTRPKSEPSASSEPAAAVMPSAKSASGELSAKPTVSGSDPLRAKSEPAVRSESAVHAESAVPSTSTRAASEPAVAKTSTRAASEPAVARTSTSSRAASEPAVARTSTSTRAASEPAVARTSTSSRAASEPAVARTSTSSRAASEPAVARTSTSTRAASEPAVARTSTSTRAASEPAVARTSTRASSEPAVARTSTSSRAASEPAVARTSTSSRAASEPAVARTSTSSRAASEPAVPRTTTTTEETRTPGSAFVLPANPLMNMTDASLEGLVDCRLFESQASAELFDVKDTKVAPSMLDLADEPTPLPAPIPARMSTMMDAVTPVRHATGFEPTTVGETTTVGEVTAVGEQRTPPPLEPPPQAPSTFARASSPVVGEMPRPALARGSVRGEELAARASFGHDLAPSVPAQPEPTPLPPPPAVGEPFAPLALPYAATRLPDLNVGKTNKNAQPLVSRSVRNRLLLAIVLLPALGAGLVVLVMSLQPPRGRAANLAPPIETTIEVSEHASMPDDPPPNAPAIVEPSKPQPIHPVLIRSFPIAARVTAGGTNFGTTPTYIKIPANTPIEVTIVRPGFKPVKRIVTSKRRYEQIFVPLRKAPVKRGAR